MAELAMLTPSPSPEAYNEAFFFQLSGTRMADDDASRTCLVPYLTCHTLSNVSD
jgi:hypothetical protein